MALPKLHGLFRIYTKEIKYLQDGTAVLSLNLVSSSKYKTKSGEDREDTCWLNGTALGKQAETINTYFNEKDRILLNGDLKLEAWQTQAGEKRSKHTLKIDSFEFIERKSDNVQNNNQDHTDRHNVSGSMGQPAQHQRAEAKSNLPENNIDITDQDIPF